jgi:hypothetical protein
VYGEKRKEEDNIEYNACLIDKRLQELFCFFEIHPQDGVARLRCVDISSQGGLARLLFSGQFFPCDSCVWSIFSMMERIGQM